MFNHNRAENEKCEAVNRIVKVFYFNFIYRNGDLSVGTKILRSLVGFMRMSLLKASGTEISSLALID